MDVPKVQYMDGTQSFQANCVIRRFRWPIFNWTPNYDNQCNQLRSTSFAHPHRDLSFSPAPQFGPLDPQFHPTPTTQHVLTA